MSGGDQFCVADVSDEMQRVMGDKRLKSGYKGLWAWTGSHPMVVKLGHRGWTKGREAQRVWLVRRPGISAVPICTC